MTNLENCTAGNYSRVRDSGEPKPGPPEAPPSLDSGLKLRMEALTKAGEKTPYVRLLR
jgi:hypothetical protein